MLSVCTECSAEIPARVFVQGRWRELRGRKRCLDCLPLRPLREPRKPVVRQAKTLICAACGRAFAAKQLIDGVMRSLYRRSFCLQCSPFGSHNTSRYPLGSTDPARLNTRRRRRREQFRRSLRKRRRARKQRCIEARGGRCTDCGYAACPDALDLHHRDPQTKDFRLGSFNGSLERLLQEAEKCDLVCANCHAVRHDWEAMQASARQVELRRETKARAVALFGGACQGCGQSHSHAVYQFHHLDPDKKEFAISTKGINRPWDATAAELAKCAMLCANCHREVHAGVRVLDPSTVGPKDLAAASLAA